MPVVSLERRIARPRLAERIAAGLQRGAVLLVAEAGFGKSWALEEALGLHEGPSATVRCRPEDSDAGRLLLHVVDALHVPLGSAADTLAAWQGAPDVVVEPPVALGALLRELERLLVEPLVLVVEDAEHVVDGDGLALVGDLLGWSGHRLRVAVASRRPLPLRLARLRAAGRLLEVGGGELAFDRDECAAALAAGLGRQPSDAEACEAFEATGGWPLGVALAALGDGLPGFLGHGSREEVFAYLAEEILDALPAGLRAAVLDASVTDELDALAVEALALPDDLPAELLARGLFVQRTGPGACRFHPLFRTFLCERLEAERTGRDLRDLRSRLAGGLAAAGRVPEAVDLWLAAGGWEEALDALARAGVHLVRAAPGAIEAWLRRIPPEARDHPAQALLSGWLAWLHGDAERATDQLRIAIRDFRSRGEVKGEWAARLALIEMLDVTPGREDEAVALAEGFDSPAAESGGAAAPGTAIHAAIHLLVDPGVTADRLARSNELARRALEHPNGRSLTPVEDLRRSILAFLRGDIYAATAAARASYDALSAHDPIGMRWSVAYTLGGCYGAAGLIEPAVEWQRRSAAGAKSAGRGSEAAWSRAAAALTLAQGGDVDAAEAELAQLDREAPVSLGGSLADAARALVAALRGEAEAAEDAAARVEPAIRGLPPAERVELMSALSRTLVLTGRITRAAVLVAEWLAAFPPPLPDGTCGFLRARVHALDAAVRHAAGGPVADALGRMWSDAGAALPHVLRVEGALIRPVLWDAMEAGDIAPTAAVAAIAEAWPGGDALVELTDHPNPAVRAAALAPAAISGRPDALRRAQALVGDGDPAVAHAAQTALRRARQAPPPRHFRLFGGFRFGRGSWQATEADWGRPMAARIVRFLLLRAGAPVPEDDLFEAFWPDRDPTAARRALQVNVSHARALLDPPGSERSCIESGERAYRLILAGSDSVDAWRFEAAAARALDASPASRLSHLEHAATLWLGEPLPEERYSDWAAPARERLTERYATVLGALAAARDAAADHAGAVAAARLRVGLDPLDEHAQRELMRAYARAGRTERALRQYLECRRRLIDELGIEPSAASRELHARILRGDPV